MGVATVEFDTGYSVAFQANRGPNEQKKNRQTVYGSVCLYCRYGNPPERGHSHCELPTAANPSINQTLF